MMVPELILLAAVTAALLVLTISLWLKLVHVERVVNANADSSLILERELDDLIVGFEALTGRL